MKLVDSKLNLSIEMSENVVNVLVVENKITLSYVIENIWKQCNGQEGDFVLSENKMIKIDKEMEVIINPFDLNFNNKKIISALYSNLSEKANELIEEKAELNSKIINFLDKIILSESYAGIEFALDFSWNDLFKMYNIKIDDNYNSLLNRMTEYIKLITNFCGIKVLCIINIKTYLSEQELSELYACANHNKIFLLLIEASESEKLFNEKIIIIDEDDCLIVK